MGALSQVLRARLCLLAPTRRIRTVRHWRMQALRCRETDPFPRERKHSMKLHPLFIALALVAGASLAQTPAGAKGPADASPSPAAAVSPSGAATSSSAMNADQAGKKAAHPKHASKNAKKHHANEHARAHHAQHYAQANHHERHASARRHEQHYASAHRHGERMAMAGERHHGTRVMGAGPARPMTDLNSSSRQRRIDQAYADWQARRR
jgi:hypothetical protein